MSVALNETESELVLRILKNYLPELREEVYKTENFDWRQSLKTDEAGVKELIARLESAVGTAQPR